MNVVKKPLRNLSECSTELQIIKISWGACPQTLLAYRVFDAGHACGARQTRAIIYFSLGQTQFSGENPANADDRDGVVNNIRRFAVLSKEETTLKLIYYS